MKKILFSYHCQNQIAIQVLPVQISLINTSYSLQLLEVSCLLYKMELDSFTFSVFRATSSKSQKLSETYIFHMFPVTVISTLSLKLDIISIFFRENSTLKKLCMFFSDDLTTLGLFSNVVRALQWPFCAFYGVITFFVLLEFL